MKKIICIALLCCCQFTLLTAQEIKKTNSQHSGNPIIEGWYADPEGVIFNDQYWIFPTYSAKYKSQVFLDAFSSTNLVDWKKHSRIIDTSIIKWAYMAMWAPLL